MRDATVLCFRLYHITIVFVTTRDKIFEKKREDRPKKTSLERRVGWSF
jgi:hypothetical protein